MPLEDVRGSFLEWAAEPGTTTGHATALVHVADEVRDPGRAELAHENLDVGEPTEQVVEDERRQGVSDRPFAVGILPLPGREAERRDELPSPLGSNLGLVVELGDVIRHNGLRLVDPRPERVEVRVSWRASVRR